MKNNFVSKKIKSGFELVFEITYNIHHLKKALLRFESSNIEYNNFYYLWMDTERGITNFPMGYSIATTFEYNDCAKYFMDLFLENKLIVSYILYHDEKQPRTTTYFLKRIYNEKEAKDVLFNLRLFGKSDT
jgi:hypothetical protein